MYDENLSLPKKNVGKHVGEPVRKIFSGGRKRLALIVLVLFALFNFFFLRIPATAIFSADSASVIPTEKEHVLDLNLRGLLGLDDHLSQSVSYLGTSTIDFDPPSQAPSKLTGPDPQDGDSAEKTPMWHNLTDEQLFLKASSMPIGLSHNHSWTPKLALLFLTRGPLPFHVLWGRWLKGHDGFYSVYVHPRPGYKYGAEVADVFRGREIPSQDVEWGRVNIVDAERRLLANALLDADNQRFVLVSEACIPLWNFTFVYHYLMDTNISYLAAFDDPGPHGRGRYNWNMRPEIEIDQWRKGAQWFEFTRKVSRDVVADTKFYPKFLWFCLPSCYADEHYFPTMLTTIDGEQLANRSITSADWGGGGAHPKSFVNVEMKKETIIHMRGEPTCEWNGIPDQPCFLFGRKLEPSTRARLMVLARFMGF